MRNRTKLIGTYIYSGGATLFCFFGLLLLYMTIYRVIFGSDFTSVENKFFILVFISEVLGMILTWPIHQRIIINDGEYLTVQYNYFYPLNIKPLIQIEKYDLKDIKKNPNLCTNVVFFNNDQDRIIIDPFTKDELDLVIDNLKYSYPDRDNKTSSFMWKKVEIIKDSP